MNPASHGEVSFLSLPLAGNAVDLDPSPCGGGLGRGSFQMVRPAEQSRPDTVRHRLTGSWLLRKWTPSQPSPTTRIHRSELRMRRAGRSERCSSNWDNGGA